MTVFGASLLSPAGLLGDSDVLACCIPFVFLRDAKIINDNYQPNLDLYIFLVVRTVLLSLKEFGRYTKYKHFTKCVKMNKSRRMRWEGHGAYMGEIRNAYKILIRKPEGKRQFIRLRYRWEDNIRIDLREIGWKV
jgi:hypothetical protein